MVGEVQQGERYPNEFKRVAPLWQSIETMTASSDTQLGRAIESLSVPGILLAHRVIANGDEMALLPEEQEAFAKSVVKVRRASGAARIAARSLLPRLGQTTKAIMKSASGMPIWPAGIAGSLAHDSEIAIAVAAKRYAFSSVGIDIEPAAALDPVLLATVATDQELGRVDNEPWSGRLRFCVKEAVYKATYPLDGVFLDYHDVEVDFATKTAATCGGRVVSFRYCASSHIVVLAFVAADVKITGEAL